jgi:signal transduction histidine kinase
MTLASAAADVGENISARLTAALAVDPALAIWTVWQTTRDSAKREPSDSPHSIASLAHWLAPRLLHLLDWQAVAPAMEVSADQHSRYAALVAESVAAAHHAVRSLGREDFNFAPEHLAALAGQWPQWLLASQSDDQPSNPPSPEWPFPAPLAALVVSTEARTAGDEAWRRWLTEIPGVQWLLPSLMVPMRRLADLESSFDHRLETAKLDALKEFAYGAGHELNNPLANIASRAQMLLKEESHPERRRRLAAINTQAFRAHEMLADMMLFARPPQPILEQIDLVPLVDDVLAGLSDVAAQQQTMLHGPTRREPLHVDADSVQLRVALRAVCINSLEALNQGGNITIEICRSDEVMASEKLNEPTHMDLAQIAVTDDGPGISPEIAGKIFDPFFSGREAGRGLGFGLSKCWRIITLHGGRIDVYSAPGQGATVTISLPLTVRPMSPASA